MYIVHVQYLLTCKHSQYIILKVYILISEDFKQPFHIKCVDCVQYLLKEPIVINYYSVRGSKIYSKIVKLIKRVDSG